MVSTQSDGKFVNQDFLSVVFFLFFLSLLYRSSSAMFLLNLLLSVVVYAFLILSEVRQNDKEVTGYSSLQRSSCYQL